jgi:hypothetical protein
MAAERDLPWPLLAVRRNYGLSTAGQYVCPRCDLKQQEEADRERQRK